ncbi:MAG: biopolymer transporter ExbD [Pseudomonadota bacterium]
MTALVKARRRELQKRSQSVGRLNLVSLMDIFTILVFFLMVNSSDVEVLQTNADVKLPDSNSEQRPEEQTMITVSDEDVLVMGRSVASVAELTGSEEAIAGLADELRYQGERKARGAQPPDDGFEVTIMGDREIPYWLLKRIMLTCQQENFLQMSLAVNQLQGDGAAVGAGR